MGYVGLGFDGDQTGDRLMDLVPTVMLTFRPEFVPPKPNKSATRGCRKVLLVAERAQCSLDYASMVTVALGVDGRRPQGGPCGAQTRRNPGMILYKERSPQPC